MTETIIDWLPKFAKFAKFSSDFVVGDFVELKSNAPKEAKEAYRKYINFVSRKLQNWDDLIIENRRIVGIVKTAKGKSRKQCEIVLKLVADGWIKNNPFIQE